MEEYNLSPNVDRDYIEVNLDLHDKTSTSDVQEYYILKQGDHISRVLRCNLTKGGLIPIDLKNSVLTLYIKKADMGLVAIKGTVVDATNGIVDFPLTRQSLAIADKIICEVVKIGSDASTMSFPLFTLQVEDSIADDDMIESTDEFSLLNDSLAKVSDCENRLNTQYNKFDEKFDNKYTEISNQFETKYNGLEEEYAEELTSVKEGLEETNAQLSQNFTDVRFHISQLFKEKMNNGDMIAINQINKNSGKIDQSYLSDDLIQMIAGNAPVSMIPADGSITPIKNAYPTLIGEYPSENLLNLATVTKGHYVYYMDGVVYELASHAASDYIPVTGGQHYVSTQNEQTAFYDGNKQFISGVTGIGNGGQTIPSNAKYMRMSINMNDLPTAMISKDRLPIEYYPYEAKLPPQLIKGYERYIPSETEKIVIIGTKIKFKGDMTLFDTVRRNYIRISGEYDLPNNGDCLVLNIINGEIKVVNYHTTLNALSDNFVVLFVEYGGRYLSSIFDDRQVIQIETRRNIYVSKNKNADYTTITEAINDCKLAPKNYQYNIIVDDGFNEYS